MKRLALILMILSMLAIMVGIASAQDDARSKVRGGIIREVLQVASTEIGLPVSDILTQLQPAGATLADIIEANGGSVDNVVATSVANMTERANQAVTDGDATQEQVDRLLSNLEQLITDGINGDLSFVDNVNPFRKLGRALITAITDETGLDARTVLQAVRDGSTLAEVIEANGGSVDSVVDSTFVATTDRINEAVANERITQEQADNILSSLEQTLTDILNGEFEPPSRDGGEDRPRDRNGRQAALGVLRQIAEETGLTVRDIVPQLRDGTTPAEILTDNGVDVDVFVDGLLVKAEERLATAVENGRLTQEQADERLDTVRTTLTERLNNPIDPPERESDA
jgi:uncharacterized protein (DUF433 family)